MFKCQSGRHWWLNETDARFCCNGYTRILVLGGGDNQQECAGIFAGRAWIKPEQQTLRGNVGPKISARSSEWKDGKR